MNAPPLVDDRDLEAAAIHEAAHVVMALRVGKTVASVTVARDDGKGGRVFTWVGEDPHGEILFYAAGVVAEKMSGLGTCADPGAIDRVGSAPAVEALAARYGVSEAVIRSEADREAGKILAGAETWRAVQALAAELIEHGTLVGTEITRAIHDANQIEVRT